MTGEDIRDMVASGTKPVIEFGSSAEELESYPESGMRARILSCHYDMDCWIVMLDYSEFDQHNQLFESSTYYDSAGAPTLTAREAGFYKVQEKIYLPTGDLSEFFTFYQPSPLFAQFQAENTKFSYVQWLENKLMEKMNVA